MSRHGYIEDMDDQWGFIRWRGAVKSALRGQCGQSFLRELVAALEALPEKRLIRRDLEEGGQVCALGAVGRERGMELGLLDPADYSTVAEKFRLPEALAREVMYLNDEGGSHRETDEQRFTRMRAWAQSALVPRD